MVRTQFRAAEAVTNGAPSPLHMNETAQQEHVQVIAGKWRAIAESGPSKNAHWSEVRGLSAMELRDAPVVRGDVGSVEAARVEMRGLMAKANAMGFRPDQRESAGAYLDRVAKEMGEPIPDKQLIDRASTMWNAMGKFIPLRGNLHPAPSAEGFVTQTILPGMESTPAGKEFLQVQNVLRHIREHTGISPAHGEDVRAYAERAIRVQLQKTPTLHADMLMQEKVATPPVPAVSVPAIRPSARWDQQA